ncbi:MAG: D-alanyl-D-alanine carboxypeptidase/D-alanyl-D-alanine-endopeptidase [Hydrogenophaga sp.]|jgi:D-alanyl-D-alanine carboxypeptidase/D-alanyl-D-alanine-endopeptidase (penicillin-binding protein 4)|uniref:D-alanyl-D-alanine carboxypeptidase/D-alanyl-D-alanine endopeptidase n=1 Tax=Hydrogenophaga sp. TaxID=1904254 RepID=UPI0027212B12|nr:D-alanyl-D-alanine carboxypeptidase/D-alanyl-D-alanine-endopeptidase [Hydrogenophaga sp.]MDO9481178.1 D-alanyl-D-alanine carboxypeptidase/D-alanyl-D-alanine-endopeptidase [Hydrogenophaga sp.]MDP1892735.1 D-alanyl-D-alanine carboxypeptidase/D-alanyl-D-alanine-endopeptidase [Hydrogenophaga sp.]MDP2092676.1 D-alanyl-D-alanine carboxypeptidase/D-alanyl-D-alanine-endopeptidase [Hydrogenophaga sp.]MDP3344539.1 D-alanyl-D-alanine carboxypeptidase/D-alanyl-D-alanine-endopeptidase [Hydrogenophaga sp.
MCSVVPRFLLTLRLLLAAWAGLTLPACAQSAGAVGALPPGVSAALARAGVPASAFSALVVPLDASARERLRYRADASVNPASVMKLVTTYAAIDLLGPDFTWNTRFYSDGVVSQGVLRGNLYVRGGGDPKLVLERIQAAFMNLQDQGVRVILGDMVLDHSAFELPAIDPGAFDGEALRPYNAAPDALLVNFKSVVLTFQPDTGAGVARVRSEPPMAGLAIDAAVPLSRAACGDWRGSLQARFDDANRIRFEGRYPGSCGERVWPVAYQDPASYAARSLEGLWRASGGAITGAVRAGLTPPGAQLLHEARSLPLSDIITDVNQWSNNVMAQQVFLTLGQLSPTRVLTESTLADRLAPMRTARFERSREVVASWWKRTFGLRYTAPVMDNGAGLSRMERITPEALVGLLRHAAAHPQGSQFVQSLSIAGVNGTTARMARGANSAARGNAWLKTGTLRDVTGIAGYVNAASGQRYAVVGFINDPNAPAARPALEALVEWAAAQPD